MKKAFVILLATTLIACGGYFWFANTNDKSKDEQLEIGKEPVISVGKKLDNPLLFLEEAHLMKDYVPLGAYFSEQDLRVIMHEMSHQKVHAEEKWGKRLMEPETVELLYKMLDNYEYHHEEFYREVLSEWRAGNFENAVEHHNELWSLEDGTIGRATRLLTPEEEQIYIDTVKILEEKR